MQTLRQLVCGSDFSECAEQALALSLRLAAAASARVTLVHVCELDGDALDERRLVQSRDALAQLVSRHSHAGVALSGIVRCGVPSRKLENVAVEVGAELIVVGRSGAGRGFGAAIGSVAAQLVREAQRSVLTVACDFNCLLREANGNNRTS